MLYCVLAPTNHHTLIWKLLVVDGCLVPSSAAAEAKRRAILPKSIAIVVGCLPCQLPIISQIICLVFGFFDLIHSSPAIPDSWRDHWTMHMMKLCHNPLLSGIMTLLVLGFRNVYSLWYVGATEHSKKVLHKKLGKKTCDNFPTCTYPLKIATSLMRNLLASSPMKQRIR